MDEQLVYAFRTLQTYENAFVRPERARTYSQRLRMTFECVWNVKNDVLSYLFGTHSLTVRVDLGSLLKQGQ